MIEFAFIFLAFLFAFMYFNSKNEAWKLFFFLMIFLMLVLVFAAPRFETWQMNCIEYSGTTCSKYNVSYGFTASDTFIFVFGMLLVAVFLISLTGLFVKVSEKLA